MLLHWLYTLFKYILNLFMHLCVSLLDLVQTHPIKSQWMECTAENCQYVKEMKTTQLLKNKSITFIQNYSSWVEIITLFYNVIASQISTCTCIVNITTCTKEIIPKQCIQCTCIPTYPHVCLFLHPVPLEHLHPYQVYFPGLKVLNICEKKKNVFLVHCLKVWCARVNQDWLW